MKPSTSLSLLFRFISSFDKMEKARAQYGDDFLRQCRETSTEPQLLPIKECGGLCGNSECCSMENNDGLPPSSGLYLCYWKQTEGSYLDESDFPTGGGRMCPDASCLSRAAVITSTPPYPKHTNSTLQVHFTESTLQGEHEASIYTKEEAYSWDFASKELKCYYADDADDDEKPWTTDCPRPFFKIPQSINPNIDKQQMGLERHGGPRSDVWTMSRSDLVPLIKPTLDQLAANTMDRPIPRYQMIIDPKISSNGMVRGFRLNLIFQIKAKSTLWEELEHIG